MEKRLERIEEKLDRIIELHESRLTRLETQAGFIKASLAFVSTMFFWALNKLTQH